VPPLACTPVLRAPDSPAPAPCSCSVLLFLLLLRAPAPCSVFRVESLPASYHPIFVFDDCVFLLGRQCGESKCSKTLKLSERVYPSACCKVQKHYLRSWTISNLRLCLEQSSVHTPQPNTMHKCQVPTMNHDASSK
jgi:hypothetical protein